MINFIICESIDKIFGLYQKRFFRNDFDQLEAREIVFEDAGDGESIQYVIEEASEYDENTQSTNDYEETEVEYIYEEDSQTLDSPEPIEEEEIIFQQEEDDDEQPESYKDNETEEPEPEKKEILKPEDIKKEEELIECDICQKTFRTTAVIF